ncbi:MAG: hypothetical protein RsTaC01_0837 [Candidatus Paraimprobicoccus trichonymphae]|uniref:DUF11 domain-containing protein n=1 Tax=Candidatus Paraimprobicoccus trichonymphae TaxID=3033793 RepID=A0AA48I6E0_9FIRM|nr:MAG: hypothetical protein RsTaC01_0837 [Candidatus Paraimprobicoccus trichonymphae]
MTPITNRAFLTYTYGNNAPVVEVSSNLATAEVPDTLSVEKISIGNYYRPDGSVVYLITITNNSDSDINITKLEDDLGKSVEFDNQIGNPLHKRLKFIEGTALISVNNENFVPIENFNFNDENGNLIFIDKKIEIIPSGSSIKILFETKVTNKADVEIGSTITNKTTAYNGPKSIGDYEDIITVDDFADVKIFKFITPENITSSKDIIYNFTMLNYGNVLAKDVVLTDTFESNAISEIVSVKVDGTNIESCVSGICTLKSDVGPCYNYDASSRKLDIRGITIPAATFVKNNITEKVTTTPGNTSVIVNAKL